MPREYAQIRTGLWAEPTVTALPRDPQRAYLLAYTLPELNRCGVVPFTLKRWARLAHDDNPKKLRAAFTALERARMVVIDEDTEELLVRTYLRWDGLLTQPQVVGAMVRDFRSIASPIIRDAFLNEVRRIWYLPILDTERRGLRIALGVTEDAKQAERVGEGIGPAMTQAIAAGSVEPFDRASLQGLPEGLAEALARRSYSTTTPSPAPAPGRGDVDRTTHQAAHARAGLAS